jgi:hypothetical protein
MYFGVHWTEDRLKLPVEGSNFTAANWLPIDLEFMKNLWIPNVFVYNLVIDTLSVFQRLPRPVLKNGKLRRSSKLGLRSDFASSGAEFFKNPHLGSESEIFCFLFIFS